MNLIRPYGFYYPTQVFCVDDDRGFLEGLELALRPHFPVKTALNSVSVFEYFKRAPFPEDTLIERIADEELDLEFDCPLNLRISKIIDKASDKKRHDEFSVLIVDHSMPEMTGFALCEALVNHPIKKIMLTGEQDHKLAATAFNKGLIDYFIPKDQPNLTEHLIGIIALLQQRYFEEKTGFVIKVARNLQGSFLESRFFLPKFNAFLVRYKIVEFYLLDVTGSFLGLDAEGNPYWFLVRSEAQMLDLVDLAQGADDCSPELFRSLKNRERLVYFLTEAQRNLGLNQWLQLAHPVHGRHEEFYVAWVEGPISGF